MQKNSSEDLAWKFTKFITSSLCHKNYVVAFLENIMFYPISLIEPFSRKIEDECKFASLFYSFQDEYCSKREGKFARRRRFTLGLGVSTIFHQFQKNISNKKLFTCIDNKINKNLILVFFRFFTRSARLLNTLVSLMSCPLLSIQTFIYILRNNELEISTQSKFFYSPSILFSSLYLNLCI
jgi:hypothetical protein